MQAAVERVERASSATIARSTVVPPVSWDALALLEQFGTTMTVHREKEIHGQGEDAECCYRILSGCVRTVKLMEDGRRQVGEFLVAGDLLGFDTLGTFDFAAEAVSDAVLRRYPRRMVDALGESNVALIRRLRHVMAASLRVAQTRLVMLGRKTATERIASFLLEMGERLPRTQPDVLDLPMGRTDIADHLGLTIETVCRVLAHLRREGTIAINRGSITLRDTRALRQMASGTRH